MSCENHGSNGFRNGGPDGKTARRRRRLASVRAGFDSGRASAIYARAMLGRRIRRPRWIHVVLVVGIIGCERTPPPLVTKPDGPPPRTRIANVLVFDGRSPELIP